VAEAAVEIVPADKAGAIQALREELTHPEYLKLLGRTVGIATGAGLAARRLPPQLGLPVVLFAGIVIGLDMAGYVARESERATIGPVIDAEAKEVIDAGPREHE